VPERFLITCADERCWITERPVVFLGEWCRRIDREPAWRALEGVVARPVRFDGSDRERVIGRIDILSRELLAELTELLNRLHGIRRSQRYWRILLGHWLHRYSCVLFHRWYAVQKVLDEHRISGTIVFTGPGAQLAGRDTAALSWASNDDVWNNVLIGRVVQQSASVPIEHHELQELHPNGVRSSFQTEERDTRVLSPTRLIDSALRVFQRPTSSFLVSSYLPRLQAMLLSMRLGDVPRLRQSPPVQPIAADSELRAANRLDPGADQGLPGFARRMLVEMLPICYLEGFAALHRQVAQQDWPSRPRLIFTSNSFDTCEVFKLWAAQKTEEGRPYIIGQHGSNYGTASYCPSETECVETADAFITWGWRGNNAKCRPAFIFKTAGRSRAKSQPRGGLLLVEGCLPHLTSAWDPYPEFAAYQEDQFRFVEGLPENLRRMLTVRLHTEYTKLPWCEPERWRRRLPAVTLENGTTPLAELLRRSRLVVHSYDSTGVLENLALNIPTLCFWSGGISHLRESAVPAYGLLMEAGILQVTAQSAAAKVAEIWPDLTAWWGSAAVQDARVRFCHQYARSTDTPVATLAHLLFEIPPTTSRRRDAAKINVAG
jgi:putative transferase (TIGR04331 family)